MDAEQPRELPGLGEKSEQKIAKAIDRLGPHGKDRRTPFVEVLGFANSLAQRIAEIEGVVEAVPCGSIRRFSETVGDVDIVVATTKPGLVIGAGWEYVAFTDHGEDLAINGSTPDQMLAHCDQIRDLDSHYPEIRLLFGCELNVGPDGDLDYDSDFRLEFDYCVASIHSYFDMSSDHSHFRRNRSWNNNSPQLLAAVIPASERVVTIEDTAELALPGHVVRLEARPPNAEGAGHRFSAPVSPPTPSRSDHRGRGETCQVPVAADSPLDPTGRCSSLSPSAWWQL